MMSIPIDSSEVLRHLNSYGIRSIDDEALKSFIKDLKKLIKYDQYKHYRETKVEAKSPDPNSTRITETTNSEFHRYREKCQCKITNKENVQPFFIEKKSKKRENLKHQCVDTNTNSPNTYKYCNNSEKPMVCKCVTNSDSSNHFEKNLDKKGNESVLSHTKLPANTNTVKSKKSHCDPVELYQYYQSIWKNHKLPGENDHAQLRRAIRKRLMNVK